MLEILHLASIIVQYFGGLQILKNLSQGGSQVKSEHKAERNVHTHLTVGTREKQIEKKLTF